MAEAKTINYKYTFTLPDGRVKEFTIVLDAESLNLIHNPHDSYPGWVVIKLLQMSLLSL